MNLPQVRSDSRLSAHLIKIITREFPDPLRASELLSNFLRSEYYSRSLTAKLLEAAKGKNGESWETRRLATLMTEHQALKIPSRNIGEWDFLFTQLNLKPSSGRNISLNESVLKEGYSTTDLSGFISEFRRKLSRLERIHHRIEGKKSSKNALVAFIKMSRRECRLTLARYLFRAEEVVDRILSQIKLSKGMPDLDPFQPAHIKDVTDSTIADLPDFEAEILESFLNKTKIYWVSDATSSEINSLVEYPLTTVALVIKPPGSEMEFEIKRVGRRGSTPLNVVFRRNGRMVPPPHRFDGGIRQRMVRWEAEMGTKLSCIYRLSHKTEAPISKIVDRSFIYNVPVGDTEVRLLNYFTEARLFGNGFRKMRAAMQQSVDAFNAEERFIPVDLPGDWGLTIRYLMHITPMQAVISGTSSFRLDRLAEYLSEKGPEIYFSEGLRIEYSNADAKLLADEILDEVLCVYRPPQVAYRSYRQYVKAAFSVSQNRERADHNYLSVIEEFGKVWGTLLAVRGHSLGESFVARNVGLRSVWEDGQWRIKVIFMDHDNLNIANQSQADRQALGVLSGMDADDIFIWGIWSDAIEAYVSGAVDYLNQIYRVEDEMIVKGKKRFNKVMAAAYRKTHKEIESNPEFQQLFHQSFIDRIRDWDTIASEFLCLHPDEEAIAVWKKKTTDRLLKKGYDGKIIYEHLEAVEAHAHFLERFSFLY